MQKPVLLMAEDNEMDALLMERLIERCGAAFQMVHVKDGEGAIDYLGGKGMFADRQKYPLPQLVLLDLKMPRKDGFAVLRWRKETLGSTRPPVIVFSSSNLESDVAQAYALGANSYVVKPTDARRLERMVRALHEWWAEFSVNLPSA